MKRILILLLAALMLLSTACAAAKAPQAPETRTFTDSVGRTVAVPCTIDKVAVSGPLAQIVLFALCPDKLAGIANPWDRTAEQFFDTKYYDLPVLGQLYGGKSTINLEALISAGPQVIIDLGDAKDGISRDMNALQKQTGIPVVFIEADLPHRAEAFRMLGTLLYGKTERCEELAAYVEETVSLAAENAAKIPENERTSVMYATGVSGLNTNAAGSTQAQVIDLVGAVNAITVEDVSNKGGGNPINMEQLYVYDPDSILFTTGSMYADAASDPAWSQVRAIREGRYYEIPALPYNWMSSPPSLNMLLGIRWLGNLLYPDIYDYDMAAEAQRAYRLLWGYELSDAEAAEFLAHSTLREASP